MTGVHGPIDPAHVQGQPNPIQEKKKEAGVLDVLAQIQANDVVAILQAAGLTKTESVGVSEATSSIASANNIRMEQYQGKDPTNMKTVIPLPESGSDNYALAVFTGAPSPTPIPAADKKAAAWLSGSFATVCSISEPSD